jgi:hypothetical protein
MLYFLYNISINVGVRWDKVTLVLQQQVNLLYEPPVADNYAELVE